MKVTLDLETNIITVPKMFFEKVAKENKIITDNGGTAVSPVDRIKKSFEIALADTDSYIVTKK
jgi:hypothetical protein